MKKMIIAVFGVSTIIALGLYLIRPKVPPLSPAEPVAEAIPAPAAEELNLIEPAARPGPEPPAAPSAVPGGLAMAAPASTVSPNIRLEQALLNQAVDTLVSPQAAYAQKQEAWKRLRQAGKLDQAIAELEQRAASDPRTAEYPATLGQAYLQKCGTIQDVREQGILAMQADKVFDTALALNPANWEARFTKAVALSYWPANLNKGEEVIQHFQTLIQQQEALAPQPQFAETYLWLGDQYQKAGRGDDARTVWQRGAALFPGHEKLQTKLASAQ